MTPTKLPKMTTGRGTFLASMTAMTAAPALLTS